MNLPICFFLKYDVYQIYPVCMNFFVRKYSNFLLSTFTISYLVCFYVIEAIIKYEKALFFKGAGYS